MKFTAFHLMPYRPLDLDEAVKYRASWVVLPNSMYDPKKGADEYESYLSQLAYAEELGFDVIAVNEHHQTAYGLMPAPNLLAASLIQRTKKVKIAVIGRALPLVNNPLTIAEEFATLDNLSRGRIITGFVRGIGSEYHSTGVNPTFSHERFHEAHDLIVQAWTQPGPTSFDGDHYNFRYVNVWPRVYQDPHPPIWIPSQGSAETIEWASDPKRKYPFIVTFSSEESVTRYLNMYRERAREHGYEPSGAQLGWAMPVYVADTDERAIEAAGAAAESLFNVFLPQPLEMLLPPGYTSIASYKRLLQMRKALTGKPRSATMQGLMESGTVVCGSPRTVRDTISRMQDKTGLENIIAMMQFGTMPDHLATRNMELFASEVMPHFRN
jgi:alkanesulfonate monooxygenase SsuD/methylene tetrahydromethanopterin reductase-like flavin-dependent oxidoreductase (luciferase family)